MIKNSSCLFLLVVLVSTLAAQNFTNPLLPSGADPWVVYQDGYYYYTHTLGNRLDLWKTKSLAELKGAERKTIWRPPDSTAYSRGIWAPEIHFLDGKWYVYFAADNGQNENHRLYVIENASADPMQGAWNFLGKVSDPSDKWAIDGTVFRYKDGLYLAWSGWEGDTNGRQDLYLARMKNPWTVEGKRVRISSPQLPWERNGTLKENGKLHDVYVNEGPQFLRKEDRIFLVYSASGCWTDQYALGLLRFTGGDLLDSASWSKSPEPVFKASERNGVYAPGHNSFFRSPDGREDWILYHANSEKGQGCGRYRSPRMQPFFWNPDGTPFFGPPVSTRTVLRLPSEGSVKEKLKRKKRKPAGVDR